jgi:Glycosyltransferase family 87
MTTARIRGLLLLLAGGLVFVLLGVRAEQISPVSMVDFKIVYYGTHCLLHQCDPYNDEQLLQVFNREAPHVYAKDAEMYQSVAKYIYFPTVFPFIAPFAVMPWQLAHSLWMALTAASFIFAAILMWQLAAEYAPQMAGGMMALFLMSSGVLLEVGNAAGISISLCVIAAWCFLRDRYASVGVICLAVSLLIKPQNAGFVWIFLLLVGGMYRKRAWQTLLVAAVIALPTVAWVSYLAPHWPQELHANVSASMTQGAVNDPTPAAVDPRSPGAISISMQTVASVFSRNPKIYSAVTYLLCAPLLFV